jgi:hypothetical protein
VYRTKQPSQLKARKGCNAVWIQEIRSLPTLFTYTPLPLDLHLQGVFKSDLWHHTRSPWSSIHISILAESDVNGSWVSSGLKAREKESGAAGRIPGHASGVAVLSQLLLGARLLEHVNDVGMTFLTCPHQDCTAVNILIVSQSLLSHAFLGNQVDWFTGVGGTPKACIL